MAAPFPNGFDLEANHIFAMLAMVLRAEFEGVPISLSAGLADTGTVGADYDRLFHAADDALSLAKEAGGGQYRRYEPPV